VIRKLWKIVQFISLYLHFEWNTELSQNHSQKLKVFNKYKFDKFFKNRCATMYSGVTPLAYNDFAYAVKSDVISWTCNEMLVSWIFFMHFQFNYVKHRNILQFQYEYFFRSFTVTRTVPLFLDLCKHTFSKTEAMQLSTGNNLNIRILSPYHKWQHFILCMPSYFSKV
jgi:hypothetical protein